MKKLFLLLLILETMIFISCITSPTEEEMANIKEEIKDFPGLMKEDLYKKSLNWVARAYNSANNVIQLKDEEAGQIICKGEYCLMLLLSYAFYNYTLIIDVKNEKLRVRIENINPRAVLEPSQVIGFVKIENSAFEYFNNLKNDLYITILNEKAKAEENW
jgi:hypothetical protein